MAQITIDIPNAQVERVRAAFEYRYGGPDPASGNPDGRTIDAAFMKEWLANTIKRFVLDAERDKARREAKAGQTDLGIT